MASQLFGCARDYEQFLSSLLWAKGKGRREALPVAKSPGAILVRQLGHGRLDFHQTHLRKFPRDLLAQTSKEGPDHPTATASLCTRSHLFLRLGPVQSGTASAGRQIPG